MHSATHSHRAKNPVSFGQKISYGFGASADMIGFHAPAALIMPIYTIVLGLNPALIGAAIGITRIWDAFLDPIIGSRSDNSRSRFGRRRPYIYSGAILGGVTFGFMWQIPIGLSESNYIIFLICALFAFYTAFTIFTVPFHALGYEMASDYHERTSVMSYRMFFNMLGNICVGWLLAGTQLSLFDDSLHGARYIGPIAGFAIMLFGIAPAVFIKEKAKLPFATAKIQLPILKSFATTLKDQSFRILIGFVVLVLTGGTTASALIVYINLSYVYPGDLAAASIILGAMGFAQAVATTIALPIATRLSKKVGKIGLLKFSFSMQFLHAASAWFLIRPEQPELQIVAYAMGQIASVVFFLTLHSMTSDICDEDELMNGTRREGMYGAAITWTQKLCFSFAMVLVGAVLVAVDFNQAEGAIQSPHTAFLLRLTYSGIFLAIGVVGLALLPRLNQSEEKLNRTQAELADKRKASPT